MHGRSNKKAYSTLWIDDNRKSGAMLSIVCVRGATRRQVHTAAGTPSQNFPCCRKRQLALTFAIRGRHDNGAHIYLLYLLTVLPDGKNPLSDSDGLRRLWRYAWKVE